MFPIYLFFAIVGGALMLLSLWQGDWDVDADGELDLPWGDVPFFSLRFWVFGGGMFGLTGLILTWSGRGFWTTLIGALLTGWTTGWLVTLLLGRLRRHTPNSLITPDDLIGCTGTVELPFDRHQPGRVRLSLKGRQVEYPARTPSDTPLQWGQSIVVVDVQGNFVEVVPQGVDNPESDLLD
ncbi:MAG: NfeD family protein [Gloeomargarita sp. GMQP_bins_120]